LIGKANIATSIRSSAYMGTTTVTKVLCLLPIQQIDIVVTVMSMVLKIARLIVSNKGVVIVEVVDDGCRHASLVTRVGESRTERFVDVVAVGQNRLIRRFRIIETQAVGSEAAIAVKGIALVSGEPRGRFANLAVALSPPDASRFEQHAVERVGDPVPHQRVRGGPGEDARLIVGRVGDAVARAGDGAAVQRVVAERKRTDDDIVLGFVVQLVAVLDVHAGTPDVVEHIAFDRRGMSAVNDDTPLVTSFDGIVLE